MSFYECKNIASQGGNLTKSGNSEITIVEGTTPGGSISQLLYLDTIPDIAIFYRIDPNKLPPIGYAVWEKAKSKLSNKVYSAGILGTNYVSNSIKTSAALYEYANSQYCAVFGVERGDTSPSLSLTFHTNDRDVWNYIFIYF